MFKSMTLKCGCGMESRIPAKKFADMADTGWRCAKGCPAGYPANKLFWLAEDFRVRWKWMPKWGIMIEGPCIMDNLSQYADWHVAAIDFRFKRQRKKYRVTFSARVGGRDTTINEHAQVTIHGDASGPQGADVFDPGTAETRRSYEELSWALSLISIWNQEVLHLKDSPAGYRIESVVPG